MTEKKRNPFPIFRRQPFLRWKRETMPRVCGKQCTPDTCSLSWSIWLLHQAAAPWFGQGTELAILRKCLPPVQAGILTHTPCGGEGGGVECFLSVGQGDLGTPWGLHPSHLLAGEVPSPVPPPWPRPSFKLCPVRMNQLSQLVKAGPLVFMPSPQETRVTASPAQLSRGPGSSLYKHPQPVQEGMEMV